MPAPDPRSVTSDRESPGGLGAPPGTLAAPLGARPTRVVVRRYTADAFEETTPEDPAGLHWSPDGEGVTWVEVTGLSNVSTLAALGRALGLHPLALEDVLDPRQRPKLEHYGEMLFLVVRVLTRDQHVSAHPLSLFVGRRLVLTLQDVDTPVVAPVRARLAAGRGWLRTRGADYLAYALIDAVVDHYFPIMEAIDDDLEGTEEAVLEARDVDPIELARGCRQDLQTIRHAIWPTRDVVRLLMQADLDWMREETALHLRDCHDHLVQLQDMVETSREIAASLLEAYLSRVTLRTNEVMQVLTIISTIFLPLTFVTGLYGMNFNRSTSPFNMPELDWYLGYPFALLLMLLTALCFLVYFWAKGWFSAKPGRPASLRDTMSKARRSLKATRSTGPTAPR